MGLKSIYAFWLAVGLSLTLGLSCTAEAEELGITVHTVSYHVGVEDMNNINPGIAYDYKDVRFGALYNSFEKPTVYGAYLIPIGSRARIGVGVVTGYEYKDGAIHGKTTGVLPLVAAELDITDNVSVLWFGRALNLEMKF